MDKRVGSGEFNPETGCAKSHRRWFSRRDKRHDNEKIKDSTWAAE